MANPLPDKIKQIVPTLEEVLVDLFEQHKDGVFYMKENNKLERLRNGLYNKITEKWN